MRVFNSSQRKQETDSISLYKCRDEPAALGGWHGVGAKLTDKRQDLLGEPHLEALSAFGAPSHEHPVHSALGGKPDVSPPIGPYVRVQSILFRYFGFQLFDLKVAFGPVGPLPLAIP